MILLAAFALFAGQALAAGYPQKNINLYVGYSAGGGTDAMARIIAAEYEKVIGKRMIVINKPGADARICTNQVAGMKPDGYSLILVTSQDFLLGPIVDKTAGYKLEDFVPIIAFQESANSITVKKGSPFKTLNDVVEYAKAHPDTLNFAHSGTLHIALYTLLEAATGARVNMVRFSGGGDNLNAVMGGHVDGGTQDKRFLPQAMKAGITPLAIASSRRYEDLPDVPTFIECGYNILQPVRRVLLAPKGTPDEVVRFLQEAGKKVYANPEFIDILKQQAEVPSLIMGKELADEMTALYKLNEELLAPRVDRLKR